MFNKLMVVLIAGMFVFSGVSFGSEGVLDKAGMSITGTLDYYSSYLWRGFTLDSDPVVQPGLNVSGYGFKVSFWGSFDFGNKDVLASDETDFIVDYTKSFGDMSVSIGNTNYGFPGGQTYSNEAYIGLGLGNIPLSPSIIYYYDYGTGEGSYLSIGGSYSYKQLKLGLHAGINNELFIKGTGTDYLVTAGTSIALSGSVTCSPVLGYSIAAGDLADENDGNQENKFYGGFSIGF